LARLSKFEFEFKGFNQSIVFLTSLVAVCEVLLGDHCVELVHSFRTQIWFAVLLYFFLEGQLFRFQASRTEHLVHAAAEAVTCALSASPCQVKRVSTNLAGLGLRGHSLSIQFALVQELALHAHLTRDHALNALSALPLQVALVAERRSTTHSADAAASNGHSLHLHRRLALFERLLERAGTLEFLLVKILLESLFVALRLGQVVLQIGHRIQSLLLLELEAHLVLLFSAQLLLQLPRLLLRRELLLADGLLVLAALIFKQFRQSLVLGA